MEFVKTRHRNPKGIEIKKVKTGDKKEKTIASIHIRRGKRLIIKLKIDKKIANWIKEHSELVHTFNYFGEETQQKMPFYRLKTSKFSNITWLHNLYFNNINSKVFNDDKMNLALIRIPNIEKGITIKVLEMVTEEEVNKGIQYLCGVIKEVYERIMKPVDIKAVLYTKE